MKIRIVIGSLTGTILALQVVAQRAENDDMYFNSKDREKLKVENATAAVNDKIDADYKAFKKKHVDENDEVAEDVNPTDSYSARTVNPEYISRSNSEQASDDEQNYYVEGYTPANTNDRYSPGNYNNYNNNWNNNNWSNGNNYSYGYSPYNSWYSPYYGYCNPAMSPYYSGGSGLTFSMGYMWGMSPGWNYGMNYGWGNSYYNPYSYYPSYYSPYYNGYPYYYSGGSDNTNVNYGKRPSRHSAIVTATPRSRERVSSNTSGSTNGRSRQPVDEYYVKPFKRATTYEKPADGYSSDRYARPGSTVTGTRTRDSYNSNTRESRPAYSAPSRSSSGSSTPSRSSGGSSTPKPRGRD